MSYEMATNVRFCLSYDISKVFIAFQVDILSLKCIFVMDVIMTLKDPAKSVM